MAVVDCVSPQRRLNMWHWNSNGTELLPPVDRAAVEALPDPSSLPLAGSLGFVWADPRDGWWDVWLHIDLDSSERLLGWFA